MWRISIIRAIVSVINGSGVQMLGGCHASVTAYAPNYP